MNQPKLIPVCERSLYVSTRSFEIDKLNFKFRKLKFP